MRKRNKQFFRYGAFALLCFHTTVGEMHKAHADAWEMLLDSIFPAFDDWNLHTALGTCMNTVTHHLSFTSSFYCKDETERPPNWRCLAEEAAFEQTREICEVRYSKLAWTNPDKLLALVPIAGGMSTNEHNVTDALACCTDLQSKADEFRRCVTANQPFFRTNCDSGTYPEPTFPPIPDDEICNG